MAIAVGTNSYVTVEEADTHLQDRLYTEEWFLLSIEDRSKALISALDLQENLCAWDGVPTAKEQELWFPINGETEVPSDIKKSQIEIAFEMVTQEVARFAPDSEELKQLKAGPITLGFYEGLSDPLTVVNSTAKGLLKKYGRCSFGTDTAYTIPVIR